jgi:hypothetical protein
MSLYDLAVADGHQHERGAALLAILGNPVVARFRDAWVEKGADGPVIAVYTRQGGGNRECYCSEAYDPAQRQDQRPIAEQHVPSNCYAACNEALAAHPLYARDRDDDFDSTYATFYFRVPDEYREALEALQREPVDTDERWQQAIAAIKSGSLRPGLAAAADQLGAMLSDPSPDAPRIMEV